jgi:hypothetical protein
VEDHSAEANPRTLSNGNPGRTARETLGQERRSITVCVRDKTRSSRNHCVIRDGYPVSQIKVNSITDITVCSNFQMLECA